MHGAKVKICDPIECTPSVYLDNILHWPDVGYITVETCCLKVNHRI